MRRALFVLGLALEVGVLFLACGGDDSSAPNGATTPVIPSGSPDASVPPSSDDAGADAGPLLESCDPSNAASCPTGYTCYPTHTSTSWWVDLYGKCTFGCTSQSLALCVSMDGVCGCPVGVDGTSHCGLPDGGTTTGDAAASKVDAGAPADASTVSEAGFVEEDAGPSLPQPITASSQVCVPAVRPGASDAG